MHHGNVLVVGEPWDSTSSQPGDQPQGAIMLIRMLGECVHRCINSGQHRMNLGMRNGLIRYMAIDMDAMVRNGEW